MKDDRCAPVTLSDLGEQDALQGLLLLSEEIIQAHDLSSLLDKILWEARHYTGAEAGSIFLVESGRLRFSYVHNDVLFTTQAGNRYLYQDYYLPIDTSSLGGYAAATGTPLLIDDVYALTADVPYKFNPSFDQSSGYRTRSMLVVPMRTSRGRIVGVLQIINARDAKGQAATFTQKDLAFVTYFANSAAMVVERAQITRELILRTMRMAELRDPSETGAHVNRVAAYAAETFQSWAQLAGMAAAEIDKQKDLLRVAAMLHDVGKVAISDVILKKPGRLTPEEFHAMKFHTVSGAQLFLSRSSELDEACLDITLNHHERWDGQGYPGFIADLSFPPPDLGGVGKKGEEIPLFARVVAVADVYDALISPRVYKPAWPEEKALQLIKDESGKRGPPPAP